MFESQRERLLRTGVTLTVWARAEISELLRSTPEIVHDFFGQPWVERFCGPAAAARTAGRLSPHELSALRSKLGNLYLRVFSAHDPGLLPGHDGESVPLRERFAIPDILEPTHPSLLSEDDVRESHGGPSTEESPTASRVDSAWLRVPFVSYVGAIPEACRVIIGGPGSGKSTLLRFITLDLLSAAPREQRLAQLWGTRLPIWLPFGAWVERIERGDKNTPFAELVTSWLGQWGAGDFLPLVKAALKDKRLLLFLDGLDEWTSEDAARIALTQLRVLAEENGVTVVATSRPDGFRPLAADLKTWTTADLAPLSREQQVELASRWYIHLGAPEQSEATSTKATAEIARRQAVSAVNVISRLPNAQGLAEVPLLFCALLLLRLQNVELPGNRFRAYQLLTQQLMVIHPKSRRAAAQMTAQPAFQLRDDELERVYSFLAFQVHQDSRSGLVTAIVAQRHLEHALVDETLGIGYGHQDAVKLARQLVDIGESVSGILVRRSPSELGFFHRSLQEHLASVHLAGRPHHEQLLLVETNAAAPHWREVILAFIGTARSGELVEQTLGAVRKALGSAEPLECLRLEELLAAIGAGPSPCPTGVRRSILEATASTIETGWHPGHRQHLLTMLLSGIGLQSVRSVLLPKLQDWFPERVWYREPILTALRGWPPDEAWRHLSFALRCDDPGLQLIAAEEIARRWKGDTTTLDLLRDIARQPGPPMTRAAVLKAWLDGWAPDSDFVSLLTGEGANLSNELQLIGLLQAVASGARTPDIRDRLARSLNFSGVHYSWRRVALAPLIESWRGDSGLRDLCISSLDVRSRDDDAPSLDDAWTILFEAFGGDDVVADAIIRELDDRYQSFGGVDWSRLAHFRDHPRLLERLETWFGNPGPLAETRLAGAAQVGRTATAKNALLNQLALNGSFWAARGLLDGWGMSDVDVSARLISIINGNNLVAGGIGFLLPRIIDDPLRCYERLLELLRDRAVDRTDFVVTGLDLLGRLRNNPEVIEAILDRVNGERTLWDSALVEMAIRRAPNHFGVKALALAEMSRHDCPFSAIAEGFSHDEDMRHLVARVLRPLPDEFRLSIADELLHSAPLDVGVAAICEDYRGDRVAEVATSAAILLFRDRASQSGLRDEHIEYLRRELCCAGPDYESRRQAAYGASLEIDRPELIDQGAEIYGEARMLRITLSSSRDPNRVLIQQVLSRWDSLQARYPDRVLVRLSGRADSGPQVSDQDLSDDDWSQIADQADAYPAARAELDKYLASRSPEPLPSTLLRYLARREPRSQRLREHCVQALGNDANNMSLSLDRAQVAVDILVSQFRDDDGLWNDFARRVSADDLRVPPGLFVALARSRPEDPNVLGIAKRVVEYPGGRSVYLVFQALCAVAEPARLLDRVLHYWSSGSRRLGRWLFSPLVERMLRDESVAVELRSAVLANGPRPIRVSMSIALAAAGALTPELSAFLRSILLDEVSSRSVPSFSFDPVSGRVDSAAALIANILSHE
jgi:hypothetical protein